MIHEFFKRLFCKHKNAQIVFSFPKASWGTTHLGKVWFVMYCPDCKNYYSYCVKKGVRGKLYKVSGPTDIGGTILDFRYGTQTQNTKNKRLLPG